MEPDEVALLVWNIPERGRYLEVGTWVGACAALVADARPGVEVVCIDTFESCPMNAPLWVVNQRPNMRLWLGRSTDFAALCRDAWFDTVLVDADHKEEGVLADLLAVERLVVPGGVILAHDYIESVWPGAFNAINRFCSERPWRITEQAVGLVVLRKTAI